MIKRPGVVESEMNAGLKKIEKDLQKCFRFSTEFSISLTERYKYEKYIFFQKKKKIRDIENRMRPVKKNEKETNLYMKENNI